MRGMGKIIEYKKLKCTPQFRSIPAIAVDISGKDTIGIGIESEDTLLCLLEHWRIVEELSPTSKVLRVQWVVDEGGVTGAV